MESLSITKTPKGYVNFITEFEIYGIEHPSILSPNVVWSTVPTPSYIIHKETSNIRYLPSFQMRKGEPILEWTDDHRLSLCDVLSDLESVGYIHGDIKPDNAIIIDSKFCLIDFDLMIWGLHNTYSQTFGDLFEFKERNKLPMHDNPFGICDVSTPAQRAVYALGITLMLSWSSEKKRSSILHARCINGVPNQTVKSHTDTEEWIRSYIPNCSDKVMMFLVGCIGWPRLTTLVDVRDALYKVLEIQPSHYEWVKPVISHHPFGITDSLASIKPKDIQYQHSVEIYGLCSRLELYKAVQLIRLYCITGDVDVCRIFGISDDDLPSEQYYISESQKDLIYKLRHSWNWIYAFSPSQLTMWSMYATMHPSTAFDSMPDTMSPNNHLETWVYPYATLIGWTETYINLFTGANKPIMISSN